MAITGSSLLMDRVLCRQQHQGLVPALHERFHHLQI